MTNLEFKTVRSFPTVMEAHLAAGFLENEGIETFVRDEHSVSIRPYMSQALGGVRLDVRAGDFERACVLLAIPSPEAGACPKCGGKALPASDPGVRTVSLLASLTMMVPILLRKMKHRCAACGNHWRK